MARRRANGDGSIIKATGNRRKPWAARVTVGWTSEGKQKIKYLGYFTTKTEAKNALRNYLVSPYDLEKRTLADVFDEYIKRGNFKASTLRTYEIMFNRFSIIHKKAISEITVRDIENIIKDFAPSQQKSSKAIVGACFAYALKREYIQKNVFNMIETEKQTKKKEINVFTIEEINELWRAVGTAETADVPLMLLYSGMRINELLKIKTEHVNLEERYIDILDSKTINGVRKVPIHDRIYPLIEARIKQGNIYLITSPNTGTAYNYDQFVKTHWKYNHTRHETRHTFVSKLTQVSSDRIAIKLIVGHSKHEITDKYTHRSLEDLRTELNKLEYN